MDYKEDETYDRQKHTKFVKTNNDIRHCEYIDEKFIKSIEGTRYRYTLDDVYFMVKQHKLAYIQFRNKFYYDISNNSFIQLAKSWDRFANKIKTPEGINLYGYRVNGLFDDEVIESMIERNYYDDDISECCRNPIYAELKNIKMININEGKPSEHTTKDGKYSIIIDRDYILYPLLENEKEFFTPIENFKPLFRNMKGKGYNDEYEEEYYEEDEEEHNEDDDIENGIEFHFPPEMEALDEEYKNTIGKILNELLDTDTSYDYKIHNLALYLSHPGYFKDIILLAHYNGVYDTLSDYVYEFDDEIIDKYTKYSQEVFKENEFKCE